MPTHRGELAKVKAKVASLMIEMEVKVLKRQRLPELVEEAVRIPGEVKKVRTEIRF